MQMKRRLVRLAALGVAVFGVAGSGFAQIINLNASWLTSQLSGTTTPASLADVAGLGSPKAADAGVSWADETANLGQVRTFSFTNPMSATIYDGVATAETYARSTNVNFTGTGSTTASFAQSFTFRDLGTSGRFIYNGSTATIFTIPRPAGGAYLFSGSFTNVAAQDVAFAGGSADFTWPTVSMDVTYQAMIPEPATLALFGLGLAPVAIAVRRRRK